VTTSVATRGLAVISKTVTNNNEFARQSAMAVMFYATFDESVGVKWKKHQAGYERQKQIYLLPFASQTHAPGTP
jgi:hypothetical protein